MWSEASNSMLTLQCVLFCVTTSLSNVSVLRFLLKHSLDINMGKHSMLVTWFIGDLYAYKPFMHVCFHHPHQFQQKGLLIQSNLVFSQDNWIFKMLMHQKSIYSRICLSRCKIRELHDSHGGYSEGGLVEDW